MEWWELRASWVTRSVILHPHRTMRKSNLMRDRTFYGQTQTRSTSEPPPPVDWTAQRNCKNTHTELCRSETQINKIKTPAHSHPLASSLPPLHEKKKKKKEKCSRKFQTHHSQSGSPTTHSLAVQSPSADHLSGLGHSRQQEERDSAFTTKNELISSPDHHVPPSVHVQRSLGY